MQEKGCLSIDIGGTFTDIIFLNSESETIIARKTLTTYPDPSLGVLEGLHSLLESEKVLPSQINRSIHGTTLVTNALIERKGARTGLITTAGFRDALEIGREGRYDIYDLALQRPDPLIPRQWRFEVQERLNVRGEVLVSLDEAGVTAACKELIKLGAEAVAIVFLHAYVNPIHEKQALRLVKSLMPEVSISMSHQVAAEFREYERTSTTVANAYVRPLADHYISNLEQGLKSIGIDGPLHIMLSNGGCGSSELARHFPIRLVESGPCGGALAASYWAEKESADEVFAFDMGGTTAKAALTISGRFPLSVDSEVARVHRFKKGSGFPLLVPVLDMIEIGAGGGSIARLNEMGLPKVGPESAGSTPGPACYGRGGRLPTVTDADLVLGYINPDYFLGGEMQLCRRQAAEVIGELATDLGTDVERTAWGMRQLVDENMSSAARVHAAERGLDIRNYHLVATGGAGPVHAVSVAQRLGITTVVVPPGAGVGSAFGLLLAPVAFDFSSTWVCRMSEIEPNQIQKLFDRMEEDGRRIVNSAGVPTDQISISRTVDMRYVGQGHTIRVPISGARFDQNTISEIPDAFNHQYRKVFGRLCDDVEMESVNWRVTVSGPRVALDKLSVEHRKDPAISVNKSSNRQVIFDVSMQPLETSVFDRFSLGQEFVSNGPVLIEESESTTVIPPGWCVSVRQEGHLVLDRVENET